jgi:hypothetical protein
MDGTDLQRRMAPALRGRPPRRAWDALHRDQQPPRAATGADCLKAAHDPERRFEPLRRAAGEARSRPFRG